MAHSTLATLPVGSAFEATAPNVLVLEDEELMSALILKYLSLNATGLDEPLRVQPLVSGWDLLTKDLSHVRVAVVDILLPRVTGVDLIRDFKKRYPGMGIVPISGMATEPMKRALKEILSQEARLLAKPLRKEEFLEAFAKAWNLEQPLPTVPSPTLEAADEQTWTAGTSVLTNKAPVIERRLSRKKAV